MLRKIKLLWLYFEAFRAVTSPTPLPHIQFPVHEVSSKSGKDRRRETRFCFTFTFAQLHIVKNSSSLYLHFQLSDRLQISHTGPSHSRLVDPLFSYRSDQWFLPGGRICEVASSD